MNRFTSRKFIVAAVAQLAGLAMLIWPAQAEGIAAAADSIAALLVIALSALGYLGAEASVDRARARPAADDDNQIRTRTPAS